MSQPPNIHDLLAKADAGDLQELKSIQAVTLPNGVHHSFTVEAESTDPAELAAFKAVDDQNIQKISGIVQQYHHTHPQQPLSPEAAAYIQRQDEELRQFVASLKWSAKSPQITPPEPSEAVLARPAIPGNTLSLRWQEYAVQMTGQLGGPLVRPRQISGCSIIFKPG